jgi:hypothetical protein
MIAGVKFQPDARLAADLLKRSTRGVGSRSGARAGGFLDAAAIVS